MSLGGASRMENRTQQLAEQIAALDPAKLQAVLLNLLHRLDSTGLESLQTELASHQERPVLFDDLEVRRATGQYPYNEAAFAEDDAIIEECLTGHCVEHEAVSEWLQSVGTEHERPCPTPQ